MTYHPGSLLTKEQVKNEFCERLQIGRTWYYAHYRPFLRFKSYGKVKRIPYYMVKALIHVLGNTYDPETDPPYSKINEFLKNG